MVSTEKFCLRWNDFESNISTAFQELREDKDFFDVTLACDDDQIQGHKVILSACSPFFRSILRRNRHEHPLLYLKGVKYADLVSVLNFMYHGEVNVAQEELNSFLAVAEDLKIKGLTQNDSESKKTKIPQDIRKQKNKEPLNQLSSLKRPRSLAHVPRAPVVSSNLHQPLHDDVQEILPVKSEPIPIPTVEPASNTFPITEDQFYISDPSQHEAQEGVVVADPDLDYGEEYGEGYGAYRENYALRAKMRKSALKCPISEFYLKICKTPKLKVLEDLVLSSLTSSHCAVRGAMWNCNHCGKEEKDKNNMRRHVESHFNFKHTCPYCGNEFKSRPSMQSHISRKHNK